MKATRMTKKGGMKIDGVKVVDARKKVHIRITADDVIKGNSKDPGACAAALACMRDLHVTQARVHVARTYVKMNGHWLRFSTPESLKSEVVAFDRGGKFMPGDYALTPMSPAGRLGAVRAKPSKNTGTHPQRKPARKVIHRTAGVRGYGANR